MTPRPMGRQRSFPAWRPQDSRVKLITVKGQGLPRSLNVGLAQSRGDYLTWFSDDDLYEPEAMASMVQALESRP